MQILVCHYRTSTSALKFEFDQGRKDRIGKHQRVLVELQACGTNALSELMRCIGGIAAGLAFDAKQVVDAPAQRLRDSDESC